MKKTGKADNPYPVPSDMRRMNDPDGSAWVDGLCGDTMEMYLVISGNKISDATFYTDGCVSSRACGSSAARLSRGKTIEETLRISPADILDNCSKTLPRKDTHCAILAAMTLHKALTDYLLKLQIG